MARPTALVRCELWAWRTEWEHRRCDGEAVVRALGRSGVAMRMCRRCYEATGRVGQTTASAQEAGAR